LGILFLFFETLGEIFRFKRISWKTFLKILHFGELEIWDVLRSAVGLKNLGENLSFGDFGGKFILEFCVWKVLHFGVNFLKFSLKFGKILHFEGGNSSFLGENSSFWSEFLKILFKIWENSSFFEKTLHFKVIYLKLSLNLGIF